MNFLDFRISGQNIDLESIAKNLNIAPKHSYRKGDTHYDKYTKQTITYDEDCWIANIEAENVEKTEEKILEFVKLFYKNKEYVQELSNKCNVTLWITLYQDINQYNLHLSKEVLSKISELDIDVDITSMYLEELYTGQDLQKNKNSK